MVIVTRYDKWSGANDGRWLPPLKLFVVLAGKAADVNVSCSRLQSAYTLAEKRHRPGQTMAKARSRH